MARLQSAHPLLPRPTSHYASPSPPPSCSTCCNKPSPSCWVSVSRSPQSLKQDWVFLWHFWVPALVLGSEPARCFGESNCKRSRDSVFLHPNEGHPLGKKFFFFSWCTLLKRCFFSCLVLLEMLSELAELCSNQWLRYGHKGPEKGIEMVHSPIPKPSVQCPWDPHLCH